MPDSLPTLETQRAHILQQFLTLADFRPGSISSFTRRCGKPTCHCAQAGNPGHGPQFRLTRRVGKKTVTETFSSPAAQRKAEREIAEFRRYQQLSRAFVEVNEKICRLRPVPEQHQSTQEKKRPKRSTARSAKR